MSTQQKIAILGSGNIGLSLAKGLVKAGICEPEQITLTRRNAKALSTLADNGYNVTSDNSEAVKKADIVVLAVLPQQLNKLLHEVKPCDMGTKAPAYLRSVRASLVWISASNWLWKFRLRVQCLIRPLPLANP